MTVKALATGVAAVAAIGAATALPSAAASVTSGHPAAFQVQPVVLGAPLDPPPPAPGLPTPEQLSGLCTQLTDPGVSYTTKTNLVEGGISPGEGHGADHKLRQAYRNGNFPEQFNVTNIQPAGANATADVATTGPRLAAPVTQNYTFVNQGGNWIMAHDSALALLQVATAGAD